MATHSQAVLGLSPDFYLRLGDAAGPTAVDASGNGKNGTSGAGLVYAKPGSLTGDADTCVEFTRTNVAERIDVSYTVGNVQTIAGRYWRADIANDHILFGSTSGATSCFLCLRPEGKIAFAPAGTDIVTWESASPGIEQWVSWAVKFDLGAANTAELVINGVSKGVKECATNLNAPGTFQIGETASAALLFKGFQDEVWAKASLVSTASLLQIHEIAVNGPTVSSSQFPLSRRNRIVPF